jgi:hypothetical protein
MTNGAVSSPFFKIEFNGILTYESVSCSKGCEMVCGTFIYVLKYVI